MFKVDELLKATGGRLISGRRDLKINGISIDSRTIKPQEAFIAIKGDNFDAHDFINEAIKKRASCVIKEKTNKDLQSPTNTVFIEVKDTIKALGDIACFKRTKFDIPVIAITGSNGKSTTKEMLAWILSKKFKVLKNEGTKNNQIGLPLTLLNLKSNYDIVVLELGTNHFGEISYLSQISQPNIGIITNIGPSHLEYFKNLKGVYREKCALIENLKKPCIGLLNADDDLLRRQLLKKTKKPFILSFSINNRSDFQARGFRYFKDRLEFCMNKKYNSQRVSLKTLGYFNIYNALPAIAVARLFGLDYEDIAKRLSTFDFPCGRLKSITLKSIRFIDDTYNSNPFSLKGALDVLSNFKTKGRKVFVMGDMLELGKQEELFHRKAGYQAAKTCDIFITVGNRAKFAAKEAKESGPDSKNIFTCESAKEARDILFNRISPKPEDIILVKGSRAMRMEEVFKI